MRIKRKFKSKLLRRSGIAIIALGLILIFSFNYFMKAAKAADALNNKGLFESTTDVSAWTLVHNPSPVDTSTFAFDNTQAMTGSTGSGRFQTQAGSTTTTYTIYSYYQFTTDSAKIPISASLKYAYWKTNVSTPTSYTAYIDIYNVATSTITQTITVDSTTGNVTKPASDTTLALNAATINQKNTNYQIRLRIVYKYPTTGTARSSAYFDDVSLNITYDTTPPTVSSAAVQSDNTVDVLFNEKVDVTTAQNVANYSISPTLNVTGAVLQADNQTVRLTTQTQTKGTSYTITVDNVQDLSANTIAGSNTAVFTGVDTTPPEVLSANTPNENIVNVVFNEQLDPTTANTKTNYTITGGTGLAVNNAVLQGDGKTVQLTTAVETNGQIYTVTVSNVKDTAGNIISSNNTATFTGALVPPTVISTTVINDKTVDIKYSETVNAATAQNLANYTINPTLTFSSAVLQADNQTVRITMATQSKGTVYTITINNVTDSNGIAIAANTNTSFTGVDTTLPTVMAATAPNSTTVNVVFSETMEQLTAEASANYSIPGLTISTALLQNDGKTVVLYTSSQTSGNNYTLTVTNVRDSAGNAIGAGNTASFLGSSNVASNSPHGNYTSTTTTPCAKCHATHNGLASLLFPNASEYDMCISCHDGSSGRQARNLANPPNISRHLFSNVTCDGCHNPHKSNTATPLHLLKDTFNTQTTTGVPTDYKLCFNCHQNASNPLGVNLTNKNLDIYVISTYDIYQYYNKTSNAGAGTEGVDKGHFVQTANTYKFADGSYVPQNYQLRCDDCHDKHGSTNKKLLKKRLGDNTNDIILNDMSSPSSLTVTEERAFCQGCHNGSTHLYNINDTNTIKWDPNLVGGHTNSSMKCTQCHGGSTSNAMLGAHTPADGESRGNVNCTTCHLNITSVSTTTNTSKHHVAINFAFDGAKYTQNQSCLQCHVDHDLFRSDMGAGKQRGSNLRQFYGDNPAGYTFSGTSVAANTDFIGAATAPWNDTTYANQKGGICISCHYQQKTKNYTGGGSTITLSNAGTTADAAGKYDVSAHDYTISSTFKRDSTIFNANCTKCHNDTLTKDANMQLGPNKFGAHSSGFNSILSPFGDSSLTNPMNQKFCYKCHGSDNPNFGTAKDYYNVQAMNSASAPNTLQIQNKFNMSSKHDLTLMQCTSCHNPHSAANTTDASKAKMADPTNLLIPFNTSRGDMVAFCIKCHTSNAANRPVAINSATAYVPVSQNSWPNIDFTHNASGWYKDVYPTSHHYNNPTYVTVCTDCHDPHGSNNPLLRKYPDDTAAQDGDCFYCHKAGGVAGTKDIKALFQKAYKHPSLDAVAGANHTNSENYNNLPVSKRHAKCEDCHDPHSLNEGQTTLSSATSIGATSYNVASGTEISNTSGARIYVGKGTANEEITTVSSISSNTITVSPSLSKTHAAGDIVAVAPPTRAGMLRNVSGVGVGTRTSWTALTYSDPTYTFKKAIDKEYELCYKCHSSFSYGATPPTVDGVQETDIAFQFNPSNPSFHPVEAPTNSTTNWSGKITVENFVTTTPFRTAKTGSQMMYCFDCHGQESTGYDSPTKGPHGSDNKFLLKKPYDNGAVSGTASNALCTMCHNPVVYDSNSSASTYANYTGFRNGSGDLHLVHRNSYYPSYFGGSGKFFCGDCHGLFVHGQKRQKLIVYQTDAAPYNSWAALTNWTNPGPGNYGETSCRVGPNPRTGAKCYGGH